MGKSLSVIIPVHNKADSLPLVLESLERQTLPHDQFELIFVLDLCTDESAGIIEAFQKRHAARTFTLESQKGSAAGARNLGISAATGDYYLFLDADVVVPENLFLKLTCTLSSDPNTVLLVPLLGNSGSLPTWPFLVADHDAWSSMTSTELLDWSAKEPALADLRIGQATSDGSLDHLPAPWVFCWSSALAVSGELVTMVSGFNSSLLRKGSEDLEFGYRLHASGCGFKVVLDTYAFHLPHARDRNAEEQLDRLQERQMLLQYPTSHMEALCAFAGEHANAMLELLEVIDAQLIGRLTGSLNRCTNFGSLNLPQRIEIIIGPSPSSLLDSIDAEYIVCPCIEHSATRLPLFGFALPFEDGIFSAAVLIGLWQLLPERLVCRLIGEALRVARAVYLIKDTELRIPIPFDTQMLATHDAPYWERTHSLRRSFHDFRLRECGREGPFYAFQAKPSV